MRARLIFRILLGFFALAAWAALVPVSGAWAQPRHGRDGVQPLDRLLPGIRRDHPGNFYDAEGPTFGPGGNPHYHLKWMTPDGRVIWYDTDARSGRVLGSSPGRDGFDAPRHGPGPYMADPYDRGYGRQREYERRNFGAPPGYARPYRDVDRDYGRGGGRQRH
ncbi:MAG TPA: hypothetical protein VG821_06260 [Rhizomicrobium sp.]|nr:hypothetical protein [Rhizomicrobium sp.]